MKRKLLSILVMVVLITGIMVIPVQAATQEEINQAIADGVAWLADDQESDGSWPAYWEDIATTGLAVLKLEHRAYDLGYDSPFDPEYEYSSNVTAGLDYLFGSTRLLSQAIDVQDHTGAASGSIDDPDSNSNGIGLYAHGSSYPFDVYDTGIVLAAIAASGAPDRLVSVPGSVVDGWKFSDVAQDMVDWLAWAQSDFNWSVTGAGEGGWTYEALDNQGKGMHSYGPDNSNSGYAVLGLAYAQDFGCTIPEWVKTELDAYIDDVQDPVGGDAYDGGSWYDHPGDNIGVNILKTGNLLMEMALVGDTPTISRVIDALDYLARHWGDASGPNLPPGWDGDPAQYQTMFTTMKGLEYMGIETFKDELDNDIDWYDDFADAIVSQQNVDGSWTSSSGRGNATIITAWALLVLEKTAPPPPEPDEIEVSVDVKPMSCPNPLQTKGGGVLPIAILGTADIDITQIDPASILLEGVPPIRWATEDVATPYGDPFSEPPSCLDCTEDGPDGFMDLTLKFDKKAVVDALGEVEDGDCMLLSLTGNLKEEFGSTPITGEDVVRIVEK